MSKRHVLIPAAAAVCLATLVVVVTSRPLRVRYRHRAMVSELNKAIEIGPDGDQHPHIVAFERHRDALVRLGHFLHKRIPLRCVSIPSEEGKALFRDLNAHCDIQDGTFEIRGWEPETPDEVVIWATPEKMRALEQIIREHEQAKAAEPAPATSATSPRR